MPLDIQHFRKEQGGNPDEIRESCRKRFMVEKVKIPNNEEEEKRQKEFMKNIVDHVIELDLKWRKAITDTDNLNKEKNSTSKRVGEIMKNAKKEKRKPTDEELNQVKQCKDRVAQIKIALEEKAKEREELAKKRDGLIYRIGNIVDPSVPVSLDEKNNGHFSQWGKPRKTTPDLRHHHELLYMIGGYEPDRGQKVCGHRGYFLTGPGVILNMALANYGVQFLLNDKYTPVYPPFFMSKDVMAATAQLEDFHEQLYKVRGEEEEEEKYLIATSEQPISAMHQNEWLDDKDLPKLYAGFSTNFRKEAGSHGRDAWGIFRVHQFDKVEQFVICKPEESKEYHKKMIKTAERFYQSLNIPYEVVTIVSGELNNAAAIKYDLEGWFPTLGIYRELVSASNCTDYQSRAMNIRYGFPKMNKQEKIYVHMLNATLCATTRTLCCILENYQTDDGIHVPEVLQPYCGGVKFFPFVRPPPDNKTKRAIEKSKMKKQKNKNNKNNKNNNNNKKNNTNPKSTQNKPTN